MSRGNVVDSFSTLAISIRGEVRRYNYRLYENGQVYCGRYLTNIRGSEWDAFKTRTLYEGSRLEGQA